MESQKYKEENQKSYLKKKKHIIFYHNKNAHSEALVIIIFQFLFVQVIYEFRIYLNII